MSVFGKGGVFDCGRYAIFDMTSDVDGMPLEVIMYHGQVQVWEHLLCEDSEADVDLLMGRIARDSCDVGDVVFSLCTSWLPSLRSPSCCANSEWCLLRPLRMAR